MTPKAVEVAYSEYVPKHKSTRIVKENADARWKFRMAVQDAIEEFIADLDADSKEEHRISARVLGSSTAFSDLSVKMAFDKFKAFLNARV